MMLFRRIRERLSGAPLDAGPLNHRVQLLRWLETRIPAQSYLEIGCNRNGVFKQIRAAQKVGVGSELAGLREASVKLIGGQGVDQVGQSLLPQGFRQDGFRHRAPGSAKSPECTHTG